MLHQLADLNSELRTKSLTTSRLIKQACSENAGQSDKQAAQLALAELHDLHRKHLALCDEALMSCGLSEEDVTSLDAEDNWDGDVVELDLSVNNYTPDRIDSTGHVEDFLPRALENLLRDVNPSWLQGERADPHFRLGESYLSEPLSIVCGMRVESALNPTHRYAQSLLVSEDFLSNREDYDFHAGALLVPQTAQLGVAMEALREVRGNISERISSLASGESQTVDSTIFELLVGAGCHRAGRQIEMLTPGQVKSPDMRVHDPFMPMPTVIECKRRQFLLEYEKQEEKSVRGLFAQVVHDLRASGVYGIIEADCLVELRDVPVQDFALGIRRQAQFGLEGASVDYGWGKIKFTSLPRKVEIGPTPLYSPHYLSTVFSWNQEVLEFDGIVCQSRRPRNIIVDVAEEAIALKWRSSSEQALKKKTRAVAAMLLRRSPNSAYF